MFELILIYPNATLGLVLLVCATLCYSTIWTMGHFDIIELRDFRVMCWLGLVSLSAQLVALWHIEFKATETIVFGISATLFAWVLMLIALVLTAFIMHALLHCFDPFEWSLNRQSFTLGTLIGQCAFPTTLFTVWLGQQSLSG